MGGGVANKLTLWLEVLAILSFISNRNSRSVVLQTAVSDQFTKYCRLLEMWYKAGFVWLFPNARPKTLGIKHFE